MSNAIRKIPFVTIFDLSSESKRVQKKKIVLIFLMIPDISSTGLKQNHESSNQFMVE